MGTVKYHKYSREKERIIIVHIGGSVSYEFRDKTIELVSICSNMNSMLCLSEIET